VDPCLHDYYEKLRKVVRGPLWAKGRLTAIWQLNLPSGATAKMCEKKDAKKPEEKKPEDE
jgi:hypothetical protein